MPTTYPLTWDALGEHLYEAGCDRGVLYQFNSQSNTYADGVAWNGLTNVSLSPSGADGSKLYADNIHYLTLYSAEEFGATIEAYTYPPEFEQNDGTATFWTGVTLGQQTRKPFGLCFRTKIGNDTDGDSHGYKLHLLYGCRASPSERSYETINDSPDAITFSWEITTTPVGVEGYNPTAHIEIDSTKIPSAKLTALEAVLYGSGSTAPSLPLPAALKTLLNGN